MTPWTAAHQASLSITNYQSLFKFMSIKSVMHPTISSSVFPFSSCLQSFPASGSFLMNQPFTSGGQCIGVSASAWTLFNSNVISSTRHNSLKCACIKQKCCKVCDSYFEFNFVNRTENGKFYSDSWRFHTPLKNC